MSAVVERGTGRTAAAVPGWAVVLWAVAGLCLALVISAIGVFTVPVGLVLVVVLLVARQGAASPAALVGAGALPLTIAWLNRGGPGEVCRVIEDGTSCTETWSPWPFLAAGVLMVAAGVALVVRARRRAARGSV
ncbi:hypothetical protein KIN34_01450 [Cellulomonas sp. DKR-3]|uniref:Integral membrane protein n=1 Tax=Cellulomonas fulva TaxID=2835530 RepID=A0ABS5TUY8_9CELL|nr:hypothetical protein [Cellulomonas fulva]MBT0992956.1 hypothetical protein [Cellulomonas fulva]